MRSFGSFGEEVRKAQVEKECVEATEEARLAAAYEKCAKEKTRWEQR